MSNNENTGPLGVVREALERFKVKEDWSSLEPGLNTKYATAALAALDAVEVNAEVIDRSLRAMCKAERERDDARADAVKAIKLRDELIDKYGELTMKYSDRVDELIAVRAELAAAQRPEPGGPTQPWGAVKDSLAAQRPEPACKMRGGQSEVVCHCGEPMAWHTAQHQAVPMLCSACSQARGTPGDLKTVVTEINEACRWINFENSRAIPGYQLKWWRDALAAHRCQPVLTGGETGSIAEAIRVLDLCEASKQSSFEAGLADQLRAIVKKLKGESDEERK